jgi:hypothetical protein
VTGREGVVPLLARPTPADPGRPPEGVVPRLGLSPVRRRSAEGLGGRVEVYDVYEFVIEVPGLPAESIEALAHPDEPCLLVGRPFLNHFRITLDGPNQVVEFH